MMTKYPYTVLALIVGLLLGGVVLAVEAQERIDDPHCLELRWDYPETPELAAFAIYVSQQSGGYGEIPLLLVPSYGSLMLRVPCTRVAALLPGFGVWYAVVVAFGIDGEVSDQSNEITFRYGPETTGPVPPPKPSPLIPKPTPPIVPILPLPPVRLPPPMAGSPGGQLTESCAWNGSCPGRSLSSKPIILPPVQGSSNSGLTESCQWNGTCSK